MSRTQKLTWTQTNFLQKFASGELKADSLGTPGDVAICQNLIRRGLLNADATLTDAGRAALTSGTYST